VVNGGHTLIGNPGCLAVVQADVAFFNLDHVDTYRSGPTLAEPRFPKLLTIFRDYGNLTPKRWRAGPPASGETGREDE